jgi:hypothetical protein
MLYRNTYRIESMLTRHSIPAVLRWYKGRVTFEINLNPTRGAVRVAGAVSRPHYPNRIGIRKNTAIHS